jgi:hypothetical protein
MSVPAWILHQHGCCAHTGLAKDGLQQTAALGEHLQDPVAGGGGSRRESGRATGVVESLPEPSASLGEQKKQRPPGTADMIRPGELTAEGVNGSGGLSIGQQQGPRVKKRARKQTMPR